MVEIIAPLQEALDVELEELDAENAVSVLRKGKEAVADGFVLTAAVIGPLVFDRLPQERLDVVGRTDRNVDQSVLVKSTLEMASMIGRPRSIGFTKRQSAW